MRRVQFSDWLSRRTPDAGKWLNSAGTICGPWLLALVFLWSGAAKAMAPQSAVETVGVLLNQSGTELVISPDGNSGVLRPRSPFPGAIVAALVALEFALAAWLISGWAQRAALGSVIAALTAFSAALAVLLVVKPSSPCGCGLPVLSGDPTVDITLGLTRNALLAFIGVLAWP